MTTTTGFSDPNSLEQCSRVIVKDAVETRGWGREMMRGTVEAKDAHIFLDWAKRAFHVTPFRDGAHVFRIPMENVKQWFPMPPPAEPTPETTPPEPSRRKRRTAPAESA